MAEFYFEVAGEQFHLQLDVCTDGYRARIGERTYLVQGQLWADGQLDLWVDGQRHRFYTVSVRGQSDQRILWLDGQTWTVTPVDPRVRRRDQTLQHTEDAVKATMPGQVRAILVAIGDEVRAGDTLLILEAMKMEMRIHAPEAGKIRKINCALGDVVARGQLLFEIEK